MLRQVNIGGALAILVSSVYYLYYVDLSLRIPIWPILIYLSHVMLFLYIFYYMGKVHPMGYDIRCQGYKEPSIIHLMSLVN